MEMMSAVAISGILEMKDETEESSLVRRAFLTGDILFLRLPKPETDVYRIA